MSELKQQPHTPTLKEAIEILNRRYSNQSSIFADYLTPRKVMVVNNKPEIIG